MNLLKELRKNIAVDPSEPFYRVELRQATKDLIETMGRADVDSIIRDLYDVVDTLAAMEKSSMRGEHIGMGDIRSLREDVASVLKKLGEKKP